MKLEALILIASSLNFKLLKKKSFNHVKSKLKGNYSEASLINTEI